MSNKLTNKEIIKALEYCKDCSANLNVEIIDFITRQKTENENLKVENQSLRSAANSLKMHYEEAQAKIERLKKELMKCKLEKEMLHQTVEEIKSEAYKEFAERLKEYATQGFWETDAYVGTEQIDNLLKETMGDSDDS